MLGSLERTTSRRTTGRKREETLGFNHTYTEYHLATAMLFYINSNSVGFSEGLNFVGDCADITIQGCVQADIWSPTTGVAHVMRRAEHAEIIDFNSKRSQSYDHLLKTRNN